MRLWPQCHTRLRMHHSSFCNQLLSTCISESNSLLHLKCKEWFILSLSIACQKSSCPLLFRISLVPGSAVLLHNLLVNFSYQAEMNYGSVHWKPWGSKIIITDNELDLRFSSSDHPPLIRVIRRCGVHLKEGRALRENWGGLRHSKGHAGHTIIWFLVFWLEYTFLITIFWKSLIFLSGILIQLQ